MSRLCGRAAIAVLVAAAALLLGACGAADDPPSADGTPMAASTAPRPVIRAAAFNFGESAIVSWLYALAFQDAGFEVDVSRIQPGRTREILLPMLVDGEVDYVPEYLGTLLSFLGGEPTNDAASNYEQARDLFAQQGVTLFDYAPAEAANAFVVTREFAQERGVTRLSDLEPIAGELTFGAPPECPVRQFCAIGLREVYGITFGEFLPLDFRARVTSLASGEIDVALLFTTDAAIGANDWLVLEDDRGLEPAENIALAMRSEVVEAYGEPLREVVARLTEAITSDELTELNRRVQIERRSPEEVARAWLDARDLP